MTLETMKNAIPVKMSLFKEDLVVIEPQPVTLAPPSTCEISENKMLRKTNEICWIKKTYEVINHQDRNTPWSGHPRVGTMVSSPQKRLPSLSLARVLQPADEMGKGKYTRWVPNKAQCRRVAMPVIRSSNHLQDTQKSNPRQKSLYSNSGAKAHQVQWGGHLS